MKILILIILSCSHMYLSNNIVLPFKKMTIEYSNKTKTINDFIEFNIYTNIMMGTPKKNVAHFILKGNNEFSFIEIDKLLELNFLQKEIENTLDLFYWPAYSTTFEKVDLNNLVYSDIFHFNDLNKKEISKRLKFKMYMDKRNKVFGFLDLYYGGESGNLDKIYLMNLLNNQDLINGYYITFIYDEYNPYDYLNYFTDNYKNILGTLILGESPHEFNPEKYKEEDEVKIKGDFNLLINEIKFKTKRLNFTKHSVNLTFKYNSEFILGTFDYKLKIEDYFFKDLISENICKMNNFKDNIYHTEKIIYSCKNSEEMMNELVYFPTLYLEIKEYNLTFLFNYKELFKFHNGSFYFLIYFDSHNNKEWEMGEIFLRKYITSFNNDTKIISFYRNQIDEINKITNISISEKDQDEPSIIIKKSSSSSNTGLGVLWIILAIVLIVIIIILSILVAVSEKIMENLGIK